MIKNETKAIDGVNYRVTQLTFSPGKALLLRLFKLAGPAIGKALGDLQVEQGKRPTIKDLNVDSIGAAIAEVADRLMQEDLDAVHSALAGTTEIQQAGGGWVSLDGVAEVHFAGNYLAWLKWLSFALQVNFLGFLQGRGGLAAVLAQAGAKAKAKASPSPSTSTGQSGAS